jgi:hypothetical protein
MQKYVFTDLHEIFFGEFLEILTEWLGILVEKIGRFSVVVIRNWTPELVKQLNLIAFNHTMLHK